MWAPYTESSGGWGTVHRHKSTGDIRRLVWQATLGREGRKKWQGRKPGW